MVCLFFANGPSIAFGFPGHWESQHTVNNKMKALIKTIEKRAKDTVRVFWVAEKHYSWGYHLHALIQVNGHSDEEAQRLIKDCWAEVAPPRGYKMHNKADIQLYDAKKGGSSYFAKHLYKDDIEYDIHNLDA